MFDLEAAIADWRQSLSKAGLNRRNAIDELDGHLREEVDRQIKAGVSEGEAFAAALQIIGPTIALRNEFGKLGDGAQERKRKLHQMVFVTLIAIGLYAGSCVLFKIGTFSETTAAQQRSGLMAVLAGFLFSVTGRFGGRAFPVIASRRARTVIAATGGFLLALWNALFFFVILPRSDFTIGQLDVTFLWAFLTPYAVFYALISGIENAARKSPTYASR